MKPASIALGLALALGTLAVASEASAQYRDPYTGERHPDRYLLIQPPQRPVVRPVVVQPPQRRVVVVHHRPPPPVEVRVEHTPPPPVRRVTLREPRQRPRWFLGVGTGALIRFDQGVAQTTPAYRLHVGTAVDQAEFVFRFDLAPGYEVGDPDAGTTDAALYTAGAGFQYRFLEDACVHPVLGLGLETVFFNPQGAETSRSFAVTGRAGLEMGIPTGFGELALGLDVTGHQPLAGTDGAMQSLLGVGAHLDFRF